MEMPPQAMCVFSGRHSNGSMGGSLTKKETKRKKSDPKSKDDKAEDEKKVGFKDKIFRRLLETQVRRGDYLELTGIFLVRK